MSKSNIMGMREEHYRLVRLTVKYLTGKLTEAEAEEYSHCRQQSPGRKLAAAFRMEELESRRLFYRETDVDRAFRRFRKRIGRPQPVFRRRPLLRYAACLVLPFICALAFYHLTSRPRVSGPETAVISPGSYQALLTLANGQTLPLYKGSPDTLTSAGPVAIANTGREIIYPDTITPTLATVYNHLSTPRGGEYHITLADGSRVYLNAASTLKYPVAFGPGKREVYLSGEAWFEVARDSLRPFYVHTDATRIRVYGTVFNVNTHPRNKIQTVLVEGDIGISGQQKTQEYRMRPSQLAEFTADGKLSRLESCDITPYIAWKSGKFIFENKRLEEILDNLSLWYDVEVFYAQPRLKELRFTGNIPRYEEIEVILAAIHRITGVTFRIQGRTLTVVP